MGATRAGEKSIWDVGGIDILLGDVYQFDLRNPAKALQHYELALDRVSKTQTEGSDIEKAFFGRQKNWLQHEIAYLKTGGTFAGTVERDDAFGVIGFAFLLGASDSAFGEPDTRALYKDPAWQTDRSKVDREDASREDGAAAVLGMHRPAKERNHQRVKETRTCHHASSAIAWSWLTFVSLSQPPGLLASFSSLCMMFVQSDDLCAEVGLAGSI
jgi:hypothetical protein